MSYSQETQKSIKTNDTVFSVPIGTIRIYNRLTNEYEKCSETVDSLNARIKTYKTVLVIDSLTDKNNEQIYQNQKVFIQRQAGLINGYIEKDSKSKKKTNIFKTLFSIAGIVALLEGAYIGFKSIIQ